MPAFSQGLERALHQALTYANERHHEYATLEHLLLALVDDQDAAFKRRANLYAAFAMIFGFFTVKTVRVVITHFCQRNGNCAD